MTPRFIMPLAIMAAGSIGAGAASAQEDFKLGTVAFKSDAGILMMVTKDDFDAKHGLNVEPLSLKGDTLLLKALVSGQIDAYLGNPGSPMVAASKGADIKIIGCPWPDLTYALYTKPDIKTVQDLKGGSIGVSAPGSLPDLFARAVIKEAGMSPDDVDVVVAGSDSERISAAVAGVITAAPSSSEFVTRAPELGLKMLVHARDIAPKYIRLCLMTRGELLDDNPDKVTNFLAAYIEALKYSLSHKDETNALSKKLANLPEDSKSPAFIFNEVMTNNSVVPDMPVDIDKLKWLRDLLVDTGSMDTGFDPASIVDTSALQAAKAQVE